MSIDYDEEKFFSNFDETNHTFKDTTDKIIINVPICKENEYCVC